MMKKQTNPEIIQCAVENAHQGEEIARQEQKLKAFKQQLDRHKDAETKLGVKLYQLLKEYEYPHNQKLILNCGEQILVISEAVNGRRVASFHQTEAINLSDLYSNTPTPNKND